jgi:predicted SprT family Zn-dependent metalloprotease
MNEQMTHQTFYHELVHAIMFTMGKTNHDEEFTDVFGSLLHQYERTKN